MNQQDFSLFTWVRFRFTRRGRMALLTMSGCFVVIGLYALAVHIGTMLATNGMQTASDAAVLVGVMTWARLGAGSSLLFLAVYRLFACLMVWSMHNQILARFFARPQMPNK